MTSIKTLSDAKFRILSDEVYRLTGVTLDRSKQVMLSGRLGRHMRSLGLSTVDEYLAEVRKPGKIQDAFVDKVTTHKTSMFRTTSVWRTMTEEVLPELAANKGSARIWSGASSTGQEPASLAVVCSHQQRQTPGFRWSVLASDVSPGMVQATAEGRFDRKVVTDGARRFPGLSVTSYFDGQPGDPEMQLKREQRAGIMTRRHNLLKPAPGSGFDLIFLRNVIIYFSPADKSKVIRNAKRALAPGGLLIIGESESLLEEDEEGLELLNHCIYKAAA
ncbi:MAG: protein-glutamate O-methyltransferase CheR [Myxococcota bacterium]|nr:protein-glutamate O-methyltransferase CheR [Myxococcota bacterium]